MTVQSDATRKAGPYVGDGSNTSFDFTFKIFATSDVVVTHTDSAGVETTLTENVDYSVSMNADQENSPGGVVTYPLSGTKLPSTETLTLSSDVPETQGSEFPNAGGWFPQVVEKALDKLTVLVQDLKERLGRGLTYAISDTSTGKTLPTKTERANQFLAFDANGDPIAASAPSGGTVSAAWQAVVSAATLAVGRAQMGFSAFFDSLIGVADGDAFFSTLFAGTADTDAVFQDIASGATAETAPAVDDVVMISDTSVAAGRAMSLANVLKVVNGLMEDAAPDSSADYLVTYDASAGGAKKALIGRVGAPTNSATVATTSGSAAGVTGIPSWARSVRIAFSGVSTTGVNNLGCRIGPAGGVETAGYAGSVMTSSGVPANTVSPFSDRFYVFTPMVAAATVHGIIDLVCVDASTNTWAYKASCSRADGTTQAYSAGSISLSGALSQVQLLTPDTFDAGKMLVQYS